MNLIEKETGRKIKATIKRLGQSEIKNLNSSNKFRFDWSKAKGTIYGIRGKKSDDFVGLISISEVPEEFRIHINLIESSIENKGKEKKFDKIPGCLIGFVCRMSFLKGYEGFVSLIPKTVLIDHYHSKYGFVQIGNQMAVYLETSQAIIDKYLNDEEI